MDFNPGLSVAGLLVGIIVGLTGMGGGALMTPILVLFFNTAPAAAVSSDLVASLFMKPVGGTVHWRRATVHRGIVRWLLIGAVPSAFGGVFVLNALGGDAAAGKIKVLLGSALVLAVATMMLREVGVAQRREDPDEGLNDRVRVVPTLLVGIVGGLIVGMTSVGGGSIMIVALMWLYPGLSGRVLVGTSLVQAIPLVGSAALSHLLFGEVQFAVTTSLLVGAIPGVYLGAQVSSRTTAPWLRPVLAAVLTASALKLLSVDSFVTAGAAVAVGLVIGGIQLRRRPAPAVELEGEQAEQRAASPLVLPGAAQPVPTAEAREDAARADLGKV